MINFFALFLTLLPSFQLNSGLTYSELVAWDVGQGLWVTYVTPDTCHHFDMGGERAKAYKLEKSIKIHCSQRQNQAYFSHWDWDHINLALLAKIWLPNLCIKVWPQGIGILRKQNFLFQIKECRQGQIPPEINELKFPINTNLKPNQLSRIFVLNNEVLLAADSPANMEAKWRDKLSNTNKIRILILGHHGSKTSTTPQTLNKLPNLKASVASSNPTYYGHPHAKVTRLLNKYHIPIIKTFSWASLHIFLNLPRPKTSVVRDENP